MLPGNNSDVRHGFSIKDDEENQFPDKSEFEGGDKEEEKTNEVVIVSAGKNTKGKKKNGTVSDEPSFIQWEIEVEKPNMFRSMSRMH